MLRRTKIIATVGPASRDDDVLAALVGAGVDIFRLNFAHGTADEHAAAVERIRRAEARADRPVAVLQDLAGPKIRTGRLAGGQPLVLAEGDRLRLEVGDGEGGPGRIFTAHAPLVEALKPGDRLLLDDGRIELQVAAAARGAVDTVVVHGGRLGEHRGINAPGVVLPGSALTAKDEADLRLGLELGVDFVALSFVQAAADLQRARRAVEGAGRPVALVAKIERPAAVEHLEEILDACDAVMVARGDLGIELPLERVPRIQKEITRRARAKGLPVIVATEVLESMRTAMRPTRAEVSDAANAVEDFVDAIMLAAETAIGAHPVDAVRTLDAVIRDAEAILPDPGSPGPGVDPTRTGHGRALGEAAVTLARRGHADAIVAVTREGKTARLLSALRPPAPVYAVTPSPSVARRLALYWGVAPIAAAADSPDATIRGRLPAGAVAVFLSVNPDLARPDANFLAIRRLSG